MTRHLCITALAALAALAAVACGGSSASSAQGTIVGTPAPAGPPAPGSPPALPPPLDGAIPGAPAIAIEHQPDTTYCGGLRTTVRVDDAGAAGLDPELRAALTLSAPSSVVMGREDDHARQREIDDIAAWLRDVMRVAGAARALYDGRIAAPGATPAAQIEALARTAIVLRRIGDVVGRMQVPVHERTGIYAADSARAFCDQLARKVQLIFDSATDASARCAKLAADSASAPGWWTPVCVAPLPAAPPPPASPPTPQALPEPPATP